MFVDLARQITEQTEIIICISLTVSLSLSLFTFAVTPINFRAFSFTSSSFCRSQFRHFLQIFSLSSCVSYIIYVVITVSVVVQIATTESVVGSSLLFYHITSITIQPIAPWYLAHRTCDCWRKTRLFISRYYSSVRVHFVDVSLVCTLGIPNERGCRLRNLSGAS